MRVRANSLYQFNPALWDVFDQKADVSKGDVVRVKNLHGCPPANTMGHCHIVNPITGQFLGLVHTNSLEPVSKTTRNLVAHAIKRNVE